MKISILTIFPEMFHDFMKEPVIARAIEKEAVRLELVDIRLFAGGSFRHNWQSFGEKFVKFMIEMLHFPLILCPV